MSARRIAYLAVGLVTVTSLTACGGSAADNTDRASTMYTWLSNQSDREQWEAFVAAAQEEDPEFDLALEGPSFEDYWTAVRTRMGANDAPCILTTQAARTQELKELLMPLDELVAEHDVDVSQYDEAMIEGMTVDGDLLALPYDAQPAVLYFNKTVFDEAGVGHPDLGYTQDQYLDDLEMIQSETDAQGIALAPSLGASPGFVMAYANGAPPVESGEMNLTDPDFVEAMQWGFDLVADHGLGSAPSSGDPSDISLQQFLSGEAATLIDGPWVYGTVESDADFEMGVAAIPSKSGKPHGVTQGSGFGISETCDEPERAFESLKAITTPEVLSEVGARRGLVPSTEESFEDWADTQPDDLVTAVETLLDNGIPLETTEEWSQVETSFTQSSGEGYRGMRSAEDILLDAEETVR